MNNEGQKETKDGERERRGVSLKRLLLAFDMPGEILSKMGWSGNRVHLVTGAGLVSGDVDTDDEDTTSILGPLENALTGVIEKEFGSKVDRDMLRLKNVQLRPSAGGPPINFHALWINPDAVIGITYGAEGPRVQQQ